MSVNPLGDSPARGLRCAMSASSEESEIDPVANDDQIGKEDGAGRQGLEAGL